VTAGTLEDQDAAASAQGSDRPASWPARAGAFAVDVLVGLAVLAALGVGAWSVWAEPDADGLWWGYVVAGAVVLAAMVANRLFLPTVTGWTLGRAVFGIQVRRADGSPPGVLRLTLRELAHLLDTAAVGLGWLWPLWERRGRTFADLLARTEVRTAKRPARDVRRDCALVLVAATLVCVAATGLSYLGVYRPQRAAETAYQQISEQGPRIVEQLLSYHKDTLQEDFSRAQALTTDEYREELIAQQQVAQRAGVTDNEYFAVASAVLSATPHDAAMLVALQGQRGSNPQDLKFITATVRAEFVRDGNGEWKVDKLTVLKQPLMNVAGQ
jgi:Mce-associated membrane protein